MDCKGIINPDTLILMVDDKRVPLIRSEGGLDTFPLFKAAPYVLEVNMHVGRTVRLQLIPVGFDLYIDKVGETCSRVGRWRLGIDQPAVCSQSNPWEVYIPPGGMIDKHNGIQYGGAQAGAAGPTECWFLIDIRVKRFGESATCPIMCKEERVQVPSGVVQAVVNDIGYQYNIPGSYRVDCRDNDMNVATANMIRQRLLSETASCEDPGVKVSVIGNPGLRNCVSLTVMNSPIKLKYIKVNDQYFPFDTTKC